MKRFFQAVLFDLGDTLMFSPDPWPPVFENAGRNLSFTLCDNRIKVDPESFHLDFLHQLDKYYTDRDRNLVETTTLAVLQKLLKEKGHHDIPEYVLRKTLDEFYSVTQKNWKLEDDAVSTLLSLKETGLHLGLLSNAGDDNDVQQQVKNFGIEHFFDFIVTSASCGYRKPHPRIFSEALDRWGYLPDEIAMVGDRLDADIGGARPLGIYTIWNKRRAKQLLSPTYTPDAVVETLSEIPHLISILSQKK
ncbi:MAG: HAD family hydrolase [Chloroflexota bacterium]